MHITSSTIGMESERRYSSFMRQSISFTRTSYTTTLDGWHGSLGGDGVPAKNEDETFDESQKSGRYADGGNAWDAMMDLNNRFSIAKSDKMGIKEQFQQLNRIREECISFILKLFETQRMRNRGRFNNDCSLIDPQDFMPIDDNLGNKVLFKVDTLSASISHIYEETETTGFSTKGAVVTADGRSIDFNLDLYLSRSFMETFDMESQTICETLSLCDPLVINLDGPAPDLLDQKFLFDLDNDGILDEISKMGSGSGYLAIDRDGNGRIDNGGELFGALTGDGFSDLAAYDSDGNGWIDEGDDIWDKLLIWTQDQEGNDILYRLADKGIGAIGLQNADTGFSLNSMSDNHTNGIIRKTGVFLYENGGVGTVQHLDLAR